MRKVIQVAAASDAEGTDSYLVLCDDGTVWSCYAANVSEHNLKWKKLPEIPQDQ
jgi:hypothetical protein